MITSVLCQSSTTPFVVLATPSIFRPTPLSHTHKSQWMKSELLPPLPVLLITTVCFVHSLAAILIGFAWQINKLSSWKYNGNPITFFQKFGLQAIEDPADIPRILLFFLLHLTCLGSHAKSHRDITYRLYQLLAAFLYLHIVFTKLLFCLFYVLSVVNLSGYAWSRSLLYINLIKSLIALKTFLLNPFAVCCNTQDRAESFRDH